MLAVLQWSFGVSTGALPTAAAGWCTHCRCEHRLARTPDAERHVRLPRHLSEHHSLTTMATPTTVLLVMAIPTTGAPLVTMALPTTGAGAPRLDRRCGPVRLRGTDRRGAALTRAPCRKRAARAEGSVAQGSLPCGATHACEPRACRTCRGLRAAWHYCTCTVRVPASGVPYVPRTVWCTPGEARFRAPLTHLFSLVKPQRPTVWETWQTPAEESTWHPTGEARFEAEACTGGKMLGVLSCEG